MKPAKAPRPYAMDRFGILNPYGEIWSSHTFGTEAEGKEYVDRYWNGQPPHELKKFKVVPVVVTITRVGRRA